MANWKEYRLGDAADFIDYRGKTPTKVTSGVPLITAKIVKNGSIEEPFEFISLEDYPKWMTRGYPEIGDVVLTTEAPLGEVAQIKNKNVALAQRIITIRGHRGKINNGYLKYFLQSEKGQGRLKERETGTTVTGIKSSELKLVSISAPEYEVQTAIAEILSSLDDKIELNNQINKNLEALAQALFKQWFVDFEFPNENGKPYKSSGGEMVESELGEIPKGWSSKCLFDFANYINGAAYKDMYFSDSPDALPVVKIVELKNGISQNTKFTNTDLGQKYKIDTGDILFSWSGSPETSIDTFLWIYGEAWLNQHIFKIVCESVEERAFVYSMLKYWKPKFISIAKNKQTTGLGHVTVKDLKEQLQPCPPEDVLKLFASFSIPILDQIQCNLEETKYLSELRDALLPDLISGKLKLSEKYAETIM